MTGRLGTDEIVELLGAYALDAVDEHERDQVDEYLREHPEARQEVAGHLEVAALLAHTGSDAPAGLWSRISDALEEPPPALRLAVVPAAAGDGAAPSLRVQVPSDDRPVAPVADLAQTRSRRRRRAGIIGGSVAACLVLVLGVVVARQNDRIDTMERELSAVDLEGQAGKAMTDPDATLVELESAAGEVAAKAVVLPDGTGFLVASDLAALPEERTYQLWGLTDDGDALSLGVLGASPEVSAFNVDDGVVGFALTEEESGGVVSSQNDPVAVGQLT